jgi:tetratricopeptide (TPR) repeat protein
MPSLFVSTDSQEKVRNQLAPFSDLQEIFSIQPLHLANGDPNVIKIEGANWGWSLDWQPHRPPVLFSLPPNWETALPGVLYLQLGEYRLAIPHLEGFPVLQAQAALGEAVLQGQLPEPKWLNILMEDLAETQPAIWMHNLGVLAHYVAHEDPTEYYQQSLAASEDVCMAAFTAYQLASFQLDMVRLDQASEVLAAFRARCPEDEARHTLGSLLAEVEFLRLAVPYDPAAIGQLQDLIWNTLRYFEDHQRHFETGMLYNLAAQVANLSHSFSEALGYINHAQRNFEQGDYAEFLGNTLLNKGRLLYTWAQEGQPQFYKSAVETFQKALGIFKRELAPEVFADIHHNLGVIYSEMPSENKKRNIWAAVSVASFNEALSIFTPESYPYQYAMVCNSFGNALSRFPSRNGDNFQKALDYYREALTIRTAEMPFERAITLLNFLEASWQAPNPETFFEERFQDMVAKAEEIMRLVPEGELHQAAAQHLEQLRTNQAQLRRQA